MSSPKVDQDAPRSPLKPSPKSPKSPAEVAQSPPPDDVTSHPTNTQIPFVRLPRPSFDKIGVC